MFSNFSKLYGNRNLYRIKKGDVKRVEEYSHITQFTNQGGGYTSLWYFFEDFFSKISFRRNHGVLRCQKNIYRELRGFFTRFSHYFEFLRRFSIFVGTCINRFDVKNHYFVPLGPDKVRITSQRKNIDFSKPAIF